jgi:nucleotide-binding universal stress UspA family protein
LEDKFMNLLIGTGLRHEFRVADARARSWEDYYAHFADLVIAPQYDPSAAKTLKLDIVEPVLLSAGAPVLILPPGWRLAPVGKRVAISWNASREATRAVHDALPLLRKADKVFLFEYAPQADLSDTALELMADHLRQHDIPAELLPWPDSGDVTPIDALFALLDEHEIDLIVSGAFGHSRRHEHLFGGMTDALLRQPSMPVLLSH